MQFYKTQMNNANMDKKLWRAKKIAPFWRFEKMIKSIWEIN